MDYENSAVTTKKKGFFQRSAAFRLAIYLPILGGLFMFGLRWIETFMTHHPEGFDGKEAWRLPANAEEIWLTTTDNVKLNAWLFHAPQRAPLGTVLYSHGNGGNLTYVRDVAEFLTEHGLDVLIYDYRGYGRSAGKIPSEQQIYLDGDAAYDFLTQQRNVPPNKLVIYGLSLGTTVSTDMASRRPCAALVLEAPLSSASDMASEILPLFPRALHVLLQNRFESARKITNVKSPVLIAHGDADEIIPTQQGRKVFAAANEPKKLLIVPRGGHWLPTEKGYLAQVTNFILQSLAPKN